LPSRVIPCLVRQQNNVPHAEHRSQVQSALSGQCRLTPRCPQVVQMAGLGMAPPDMGKRPGIRECGRCPLVCHKPPTFAHIPPIVASERVGDGVGVVQIRAASFADRRDAVVADQGPDAGSGEPEEHGELDGG
jgi:hypothetical protein